MHRIDVSPEMVSLIGDGSIDDANWPARAVALVFTFGGRDSPATFTYLANPQRRALEAAGGTRIILVIAAAACARLTGEPIPLVDGETYHLPAGHRAIAVAARDCDLPEGAQLVYRGAKCLELLCETLRLAGTSELVPVGSDATLSHADGLRLLAARRMIDERATEKLTLDMIARACGLNRAKLTRGFRDLFSCTVADAIAAQRLGKARQMLLATDLPVSSIGYRCGYLNNASFTRAFGRHFGVAPTQFRASIAA